MQYFESGSPCRWMKRRYLFGKYEADRDEKAEVRKDGTKAEGNMVFIGKAYECWGVKEPRVEMIKKLMELGERYKRVNQYQ